MLALRANQEVKKSSIHFGLKCLPTFSENVSQVVNVHAFLFPEQRKINLGGD